MILYALPPCNGGWGRGKSPALMQGTGGQCLLVLLPDALWPWGGEWGLQPLVFWHWSPFTKSPWWSQGTGGPRAEVKMVLSKKKSCLPACLLAGHPQDEHEVVSVRAGMSSRCLYSVGSRGQTMSPSLRLSTEILSGGPAVPQTPWVGRTFSSQESSSLAAALS